MLTSGHDDRAQTTVANGAVDRTGLPFGPAIPPLNVRGLVVNKADLIGALRLYVPQLTDLSVLDGDQFLLHLTAGVANGRTE